MKTAFFLAAVLLFAGTGHAQAAGSGPVFAPQGVTVSVPRYHCDCDDSLSLSLQVGPVNYNGSGTSAAVPAPVQQAQIKVFSSGNKDPYYVGSGSLRSFPRYQKLQPFSLGALARQVREEKATAEKSKVVARQDNNGHIRLVPEKQKTDPTE